MADIVKSRQYNQGELMAEFQDVVKSVVAANNDCFLSPPAITLGDEFQSIAVSLEHCCRLLFAFDEEIISKGYRFKMRYVVNEGTINTPINTETAYGMMGEGLTEARSKLNAMKRVKKRILISVSDPTKELLLNNLFYFAGELMLTWKPKDFKLITQLLIQSDYKQAANSMNKDVSLVWRRKKSLKIELYQRLKETINFVTQHV